MANLIASADVAVTAGGSTMWELAALGIPFVSIVVADNQRQSALAMAKYGFPSIDAAGDLERALPGLLNRILPDAAQRGTLSDVGRQLVDGKGAARVCAEIFRLVNAR
jgi:spore coat polysaccharide biosynthesis predicted glycosyltransferase SpsG